MISTNLRIRLCFVWINLSIIIKEFNNSTLAIKKSKKKKIYNVFIQRQEHPSEEFEVTSRRAKQFY